MKSPVAILYAAILGISSLSHGGETWGKAPVIDKTPIEECLDLGAEISAGYMSDYILHGLRVNRDTIFTDVNYTFDTMVPLTLGVTHNMGIRTKFPYGLLGPIDETDLYVSAEIAEVAGFEFSLGYTQRFLHFSAAPVFDGSYGDVAFGIRKDLGVVDFVYQATLGLNSRNSYFAAGGGDGWVHYAGLEKVIPICEVASLSLSGGVGYHDGYYFATAGTSDWSHYSLRAALPIELNCRTTLTPYIGYQGVQQWGVFFPQGDALHGGVSLEVAF